MATTLSAKEAARELGTDARTFRKFMRAITPKEEQPGQGNRYVIEKRALRSLRKRFEEWQAPKAKATNGTAEAIDTDEDVFDEEDLVDLEDDTEEDEAEEEEEPTDQDLESIEAEEDLDLEDLETLD